MKKCILFLLMMNSMVVYTMEERSAESDPEDMPFIKEESAKRKKLRAAGLWKIINKGESPIRVQIINTPMGKKSNKDKSFVLGTKESMKLNLATIDDEFTMYMTDEDKDLSLMNRLFKKEQILQLPDYPGYPHFVIDAEYMDFEMLLRTIKETEKNMPVVSTDQKDQI